MLVTSKAKLRFLSIPPRKMRLVADMVKGLPVEKALATLNFSPRIASHHLAKTVKSAAANALSKEGTDRLRPEDLMISNILVDAAPTAKRIRFRSMGRVFRYKKRFCHLTVEVEGKMDIAAQEKPTRGRAAKKEEPKAVKADETKIASEKKTAKKKTGKGRATPDKKVKTKTKSDAMTSTRTRQKKV
ncbi:MAG: 50S ribosomal protein L22 [candidate division Zixibacteria bacterium]|nr:50S ribosomal protein L22 [candidate division Zixibacteria bacterium]